MDIFFSSQVSNFLDSPQNDLSQTCSLLIRPQFNQHQQRQSMNQNNNKSKRKRVNNNIFKTPLSQFRKMVLVQLKLASIQLNLFKQINKTKNMGTFLKLVLLTNHYNFKSMILNEFSLNMQRLLQKKKDKISEKRYQQLQKIIERMRNSLKADCLEEMISEYWGNYKQKSKYQKCILQIQQFQQKMLK